MRDRSKQLLVINTGKKGSGQNGLPSQSGPTHIIGGGGLSANMAGYLLKSIWDKVFEIRTDSQGIEYIFGKLPVVLQYGITMYSGDGVDIPSLASGLPFDGRTIWYNPETNQIEVIGGTGGGSGEGVSNFWDLSGIPSWITNSKPKYTYSEIEGTPDLSGFATQNWIISQGYASAEELKKYIPISGYTEVSGEKNFTGGLKVNGSPIYYDTEKKYWKLEGDLLVTGGVTMYGSDSSFTPSTITDAVNIDNVTIKRNSQGQLYAVGGGAADSVAWNNITGKPNFASVATSGKYDDLIGKPTLLSSFTDDVVSGKYLSLSGGTMTGNILLGGTTTNKIGTNIVDTTSGYQEFTHQNSHGYIAIGPFNDSVAHIYTDRPSFYFNKDLYVNDAKVWNAGNDGSGSGLDADLLDGKHADSFMNFTNNTTYVAASMGNDNLSKLAGGDGYIEFWDGAGGWFNGKWGKLIAVSGFEGSLSGNALSATKLQTARTIWGQSFDGTGNVSGALSDVTGITFKNDYYGLVIDEFGNFSFKKPSSTTAADWSFKDSSGNKLMIINNSGKIVFRTYRNSTIVDHFVLQQGSTALYDNLTINGYVKANYYDVSTTRQASLSNSYTLGCGMYGSSIQHSVSDGYTLPALMWSAKSPNGNSSQFSIMSYHPSGETGYLIIGVAKNGTRTAFIEVQGDGVIQAGGDFLASGGITMYSDQRKKTILNHVELSLKQIANAPLIEHYYNGDEKKTTHVGSIAQYWASMNDWFCKLDNEGYYTMEIQNAALASAISIARELDRYETKTDKAIKKLKKRICELEEEVERLKSA